VPVYLFFFLKETATIKRRWSHFVPLKESNLKREVIETLNEMNGYLIAFFRGQVIVSIIDGVLTGLLLWMIGLPYAFVIGIALAILGVMPFIGFLVTLIPALIIAAATWGDWQHPALVFAIFFVVQQIDGLFIQPKIIGDKVGLHPMSIIFSIFFWSLILGGFLGALLAIPLTASVKVLFTRYIWDPTTLDQESAEAAAGGP
jgi:predicted PurR-regulated permease PerM